MTKNSFSYKQGFKKGIEIYNENKSQGYFADQENERIMRRCKTYADTGYKNNEQLRETQIDYYFGMYDGIRFAYKKDGISIPYKKYSRFEEYETNFYYKNKNHYDGFNCYEL